MADHVGRFSLISKLLFPAALCLLVGCGSDAASTTETWTGTWNGSATEFLVQSQSASLGPDGGVLLTFAGKASDAEFTVELDIVGGANSNTLQVGSSAVNLNLVLDSVHYRGTSGTILFTAFETTAGGALAGSLDAGLVPLQGSGSVTLKGDFTTQIVTPTPTPTG